MLLCLHKENALQNVALRSVEWSMLVFFQISRQYFENTKILGLLFIFKTNYYFQNSILRNNATVLELAIGPANAKFVLTALGIS